MNQFTAATKCNKVDILELSIYYEEECFFCVFLIDIYLYRSQVLCILLSVGLFSKYEEIRGFAKFGGFWVGLWIMFIRG